MKSLVKIIALLLCSGAIAQEHVLDIAPETAVDSSFYKHIPTVNYGNLFQQSGTTSFSLDYSPSESYWLDPTPTDEEHVYLAKLQHVAATAENSWELRIGQGGQIYSFKGAYGEGIPPQSKEKSTWNDEVWQAVSVNTGLNNRDFTSAYYFVHGAGAYNYDGVEQTLYSPLVASYYDENEKAYYVTNWGTQAHIPSLYKSGILYTTKYKEIGEGILEVTYVIQNFGDITINHINAPWGGVRSSNLRGKFLSSPDGSIAVNHAQTGTDEGALAIDIDETGGYMLWASDTLNSTAPSLGIVFGTEIKTTELSEQGLSNIYMRLAQVGGDNNPRDYTLFTVIPKLNVETGETFYYRTYYINGTRDFVQEKSNLLAPYSEYGFLEPAVIETPTVLITAKDFDPSTAKDFELFTSPIEGTVPLFLMKNTETGNLYISPDLYHNVVTAPLINPYTEGDENFELYEDRFTYKLHESDIEYVRLLGYAFAIDKSADPEYLLLDDLILDETKVVLTADFVDKIWVKAEEGCHVEIVPRSQIYGASATSDLSTEIMDGDSLIIKPQISEDGVVSIGTGTWAWEGPNAFSKDGRVLVFEPITLNDAGIYFVTYSLGNCEATTQFEVIVEDEIITNASSLNGLNAISIYPNPTSERFFIKNAKNREVKVYNSFNQLLHTTTVRSDDFLIDLSVYAKGVYSLLISENGTTITHRIIKN